MLASGLATTQGTPSCSSTISADAADRCASASEHDLIDFVVFAAREEELQQAADLLNHRFLERFEHFDFVGFRQSALALGQAGFFVRQAVAAHDFVGELLAAEYLFARVDACADS